LLKLYENTAVALTDIFIGRDKITSEKVVIPQAEDKILIILK
jgi:hypothetical protein